MMGRDVSSHGHESTEHCNVCKIFTGTHRFISTSNLSPIDAGCGVASGVFFLNSYSSKFKLGHCLTLPSHLFSASHVPFNVTQWEQKYTRERERERGFKTLIL